MRPFSCVCGRTVYFLNTRCVSCGRELGYVPERHYSRPRGGNGSAGGSHISAYATAHPWEDWAETWAHYLHMDDLLETARWRGLAAAKP